MVGPKKISARTKKNRALTLSDFWFVLFWSLDCFLLRRDCAFDLVVIALSISSGISSVISIGELLVSIFR